MEKSKRRKLGEGWEPGMLRIGTPSDEQLKAIGRIITNFAALETMIKNCVWDLIGRDQEIGRTITAQRIQFDSLIDLLVSLHKQRVPNTSSGEKSSKLLKELLPRLNLANNQRNTIAHSLWLTDGVQKEAIRTKTAAKKKTGLKDDFESKSADDLNKIADFIEDVFFESGSFWTSLRFFPHRKNEDGSFAE